jgi:hypothetical protein
MELSRERVCRRWSSAGICSKDGVVTVPEADLARGRRAYPLYYATSTENIKADLNASKRYVEGVGYVQILNGFGPRHLAGDYKIES